MAGSAALIGFVPVRLSRSRTHVLFSSRLLSLIKMINVRDGGRGARASPVKFWKNIFLAIII